MKLVDRLPHRLLLTDAGLVYSGEVRETLERLAAATLRAMASRSGIGTLDVAITPSLAARWLVPRLHHFYEPHPGITMQLTTRSDLFDLRAEGFDAAISTPSNVWPGMATDRLFDTSLVVVCTPELRDRYAIRGVENLALVPLLQHRTIPALWSDWFRSIGASHPAPLEGLQLDQIALVVEAALLNFGVAILPHFYAQPDPSGAPRRAVRGAGHSQNELRADLSAGSGGARRCCRRSGNGCSMSFRETPEII